MKPFLYLAVFALAAAPSVHADDKVVLQLKWIHQAEFAGYYAARENGYYADEGLEVEIRAGSPGASAPAEVAAIGAADVILEWMPTALLARENGIPLVNIAQTFTNSGAALTCLRSAGIRTLDDLRGKRIGHWTGANRLQVVALLDKLGIPIAAAGSKESHYGAVLRSYAEPLHGLKLGHADCISTTSLSHPVLLSRAGYHESELIVFSYQHLGIATLQNGMYVLEGRLKDPAFADAMARFVRASMRGWRWAAQNQEKAVQMVMQMQGAEGGEQEELQHHMLRETLGLIAGFNGALDPAEYERTVRILLSGGTLSEEPQNAWTSDITDRAQIYDKGRFARLTEVVQIWVKEFILNLLNAEYTMSHVYNLLIVSSMLMRRMVLLRLFYMLALTAAILNDFFWRQDTASLFWSLVVLAVNAIQLAYISIASRFVKMSPEEEEFISVYFSHLDRMNARRLTKKGEFGVAGEEYFAHRVGERVSHIHFLTGGKCIGSGFGEAPAPIILGDISVMEVLPGLSDIKVSEGSRYWRIEAQTVRKLASKPTVISNALYHAFSHNAQVLNKALLHENPRINYPLRRQSDRR